MTTIESMQHKTSTNIRAFNDAEYNKAILESVNFDQLVERIARLYENGQTDVQMQLRALEPVSGYVEELELLLSNLLANAIAAKDQRTTTKPTHVVGLETWLDGALDRIYLRVRDNGVGIAASRLKSLWTSGVTTKRATGGTGIGLAAIKRIVDRHGGEIEVDSKLGEGTAFTIWFPTAVS